MPIFCKITDLMILYIARLKEKREKWSKVIYLTISLDSKKKKNKTKKDKKRIYRYMVRKRKRILGKSQRFVV